MIFVAELDRVLDGNPIQSRPSRPEHAGGEWDPLLALPRRTRRRLIGAGYLNPNGIPPDVAADYIIARVAGVETVDDALGWYVRTALRAIPERRRHAHRSRHHRHAVRCGAATYYELRNLRAIADGYASLWHYRKAKGWT